MSSSMMRRRNDPVAAADEDDDDDELDDKSTGHVDGGDEEEEACNVGLLTCECCGLVEEGTAAYAARVRERFCGKWVCGLCAEAVAEELQRLGGGSGGGGSLEEALQAHFRLCRGPRDSSPAASVAQAMRQLLLRRTSSDVTSPSPSPPRSPRRHVPPRRCSSDLTL